MEARRRFQRRDVLKGSLVAGGAALVSGLGIRAVRNQILQNNDPARSQQLLESISAASDRERLPNFVLIFVDDLGYGDLSVYGSQAIHTPYLDRMAAEGALLTNFYSSAPLCSASRAGLLTGRYPIRTMVTGSLYPAGSPMNLLMELAGFYTHGVHGIPEDEILLPEILQRTGYATAILGKWHLGDRSPHLPNENGFDRFFGAHYSNNMAPYRIYRDQEVVWDEPVDQSRLTQELTREAVQFMEENHDRPFFLYLAHPMPHEPMHASQAFRGQSAAGLYGDAVQELDWSTGKIIEKLDQLGIDEKTLVIFTSDNGPWWQGDPGPVRGRKNLPFEGGFRVPFIARWPAVIPPGLITHEMSMNFDLYNTLLDAAGLEPPGDRAIDGVSLLPLLQGVDVQPHERLYYFKGNTLTGIRRQNWKYLRRHMTDNGGYTTLSQGPFLFNLEIDPNESYSLIESEPEIARTLEAMLLEFEGELDSNLRGWS
jgi:uncharacterized sulfatase